MESLAGKKIVELCVGSMHALAITDNGEVYGWGRNDQGQLGDGTLVSRGEPTLVVQLEGKTICGITCGPAQVAVCHCWFVNVFR